MTEPGDIHIRRKDMLKRVGLAYSTIRLMISAGKFPAPIELTHHTKHPKIAWIVREIDEWQASLPRRTMRPAGDVTTVPPPVTVPARPRLQPKAGRQRAAGGTL